MGRVLQHHASVTAARKAVLSAYRECGHVRHACAIAQVSKSWLYWQLAHRPSFKRRWQKAYEAYGMLEQERQQQASLWAEVAASKKDLAEHRAAVRRYVADLKADRAFERKWQRAQERKRRREAQRAERDAWRAAHPNWQQLEQRLRAVQADILAQEQDPDSALARYERYHEQSAQRIQARMVAHQDDRRTDRPAS